MSSFSILLQDAVFAAGALAWLWLGVRMARRQTILPYEPRRPVPWGGIELLIVLAAWILLQGLCLGIGVKWLGIDMPKDWKDLDSQGRFVVVTANMMANVLTLVFAFFLVPYQTRARLRDLGLNVRRIAYDVRCGVIAFAATAPVVFGLQWLITHWVKYEHELVDAMEEKQTPAMWIVAAITAVIVAPLFEEFVFRVLLQGWLEKSNWFALPYCGDTSEDVSDVVEGDLVEPATSTAPVVSRGWRGLQQGFPPVLISSTVFAFMHWGQGAAPIPLFVFAIVLGFLYQRTHRIVPSLVVHMLLNGISLLMLIADPKA